MNNEDIDEDMIESINKGIKLMKRAKEVCKQANKTYEFDCPNCGNKAYAGKASINNHIHLKCEKCNITIMQ